MALFGWIYILDGCASGGISQFCQLFLPDAGMPATVGIGPVEAHCAKIRFGKLWLINTWESDEDYHSLSVCLDWDRNIGCSSVSVPVLLC